MKKHSVVLMVALALILSFTTAFAAPSAKVSAQAGDLSVVEFHSPATIFTQTIKTAEQKDLFVDVSLECGLTTNTKVMSKELKRDISEAEAVVTVRVLVDGIEALPGEVTFARRYQALIAEFAGDISGALEVKDGTLVIDETLIQPEMLALILDTMSANSFNFVATNLAAGEHIIEVIANPQWLFNGEEYVDELGELMYDDVATNAYIGKGSITIESVRAVKGEDIEL